MRGTDETSRSLFSYVDLEERIPPRHPLRKIRQVVNDALASLDGEFEALYTDSGRPSIPPERLIRAGLLQILFSIRSERQLGDYFSVLLRPPSGQLLAQVSPVRGAWTAQTGRSVLLGRMSAIDGYALQSRISSADSAHPISASCVDVDAVSNTLVKVTASKTPEL